MQSLESAGTPEPGAGPGQPALGAPPVHLQENGLMMVSEETAPPTRTLAGIGILIIWILTHGFVF